MGTDLHGPLIEVGHTWQNNKKVGWWRLFAFYNWRDRNYLFFSALAGVRGPSHNPIPVRGVPEDTHNVVFSGDIKDQPLRNADGDWQTPEGMWLGYHDLTWLTPQEWEQVVTVYQAACREQEDEQGSYPADTSDIRNVDALLKMVEGEENVRLIFGFDS